MTIESQCHRKIIHCDMDAFFASVEQRDHPELRGKAIAVGGNPQKRGVVAAASYEARKFGVRSAMSCAQALRLCPHLILVPPHFDRYVEVSQQIHQIFESITPRVESLSLDEAYLDVTENLLNEPLAQNLAKRIKGLIYETTGLTASAGVGPNKFVAKIASDTRKPNGLTIVHPERVNQFIENLPVEKLWGVGPATAKKLHSLGLRKVSEIRAFRPEALVRELGKVGAFLIDLSHGVDHRPVESGWEPKSRGSETTFSKDVVQIETLKETLLEQAQELALSLRKLNRLARTITVKIRYASFKTITRSKTLLSPVDQEGLIYETACDLLLSNTEVETQPVRLIGLSTGHLTDPREPLQLWFRF